MSVNLLINIFIHSRNKSLFAVQCAPFSIPTFMFRKQTIYWLIFFRALCVQLYTVTWTFCTDRDISTFDGTR